MTTQTPALPFPVTPRRPGEPEADLTGFTLIHRALRSGTRDLAVAATAIGHGQFVVSRNRTFAGGSAQTTTSTGTTFRGGFRGSPRGSRARFT